MSRQRPFVRYRESNAANTKGNQPKKRFHSMNQYRNDPAPTTLSKNSTILRQLDSTTAYNSLRHTDGIPQTRTFIPLLYGTRIR